MFEAIRFVSSGVTLIAFIAAGLVWLYARHMESRRQMIRDAKTEAQADLVARTLKGMNIDVRKLSATRQYNLALEQLRARSRRFYVLSAVVVALALIAAWVAVNPRVAKFLFEAAVKPVTGPRLAPASQTEPTGGTGGSYFGTQCDSNQVLIGFSGRAGDWRVFRLSGLCGNLLAEAAGDKGRTRLRPIYTSVTPARGSEQGAPFEVQCPPNSLLYLLDVQAAEFKNDETYVTAIRGKCAEAIVSNEGVRLIPTDTLPLVGAYVSGVGSSEYCGGNAVARGLYGRSGYWLDALGISCSDLSYVPP